MAELSGKWYLNETLSSTISVNINFTFSNGSTTYNGTKINITSTQGTYSTSDNTYLVYDTNRTTTYWEREAYRTIEILEGQENSTLLSWLTNNATKVVEDTEEDNTEEDNTQEEETPKVYYTNSLKVKASIKVLNRVNVKAAVKCINSAVPHGNININADGVYNVSNYATANVDTRELLTISQVTDIALSEYGGLTWTAADTTNLEAYAPYSVSYIVNVNGTEIETTSTSLNVYNYLIEGENSITVTTKTTITVTKTQDHESEILDQVVLWSKPKEAFIVVANATLSRAYTSAVVIDGKAYIFGGCSTANAVYSSNSYYDRIYCYDPSTDTRATMSATLYIKMASTSAVAIDGKAYIFGGATTSYYNYIQCYDPSTDTLTKLTGYLYKGACQTSAVVIDGKAYIFGGKGGSSLSGLHSFTQCYDPTTNTSTRKYPLPSYLYDASAVAINGKAYIFGGMTTTRVNTIRCYDPSTDTHTTLTTTLDGAFSATSAVAIGNKAYIFGGSTSAYSKKIQYYDTVEDILVVENATLTSNRAATSAVAIGNKAYIFGGYGGSLTTDINIMIIAE